MAFASAQGVFSDFVELVLYLHVDHGFDEFVEFLLIGFVAYGCIEDLCCGFGSGGQFVVAKHSADLNFSLILSLEVDDLLTGFYLGDVEQVQ